MFDIDNHFVPVSATWVKSPFKGERRLAQYGLLIPSDDSSLPPLSTRLVVPGATKLANVGALVRAVGDVRECTLTGRADDDFLAIVASPTLTKVIAKVATEIPIPSLSLGGPVKKVWQDASGDVNIFIEAGKKVAPWRVRVSLHSFTKAAQAIFLEHDSRPCIVSATVVFHRLEGDHIVFAPWSVDITYPDNPWLPLKPHVNPQRAMSFEALDRLQDSSAQEDPEAVYMEPKVSRRRRHGTTSS